MVLRPVAAARTIFHPIYIPPLSFPQGKKKMLTGICEDLIHEYI